MHKSDIPMVAAITVLVFLSIVVGAYFMFFSGTTVSVIFAESERLLPGNNVYLHDVDVGDVKSVKPENGKVKVKIKLDRKYDDQITKRSGFYIDQESKGSGSKCVVVKVPEAGGGNPVRNGDVIEGIDSYFAWLAYDYSSRIQGFMGSNEFQDIRRKAVYLQKEMQHKFEEIDWGEVEQDLRRETEQLIESIDKAIKSEDAQKFAEDFEKSINRMKKTLNEVSNSKEAEDLKKALDSLYKKFEEELSKTKS